MDQVLPVRIETSSGAIELSTAVAISPNHAVTLCIFSPDDSVTVETSSGILYPDSFIVSPDLGMVIMTFYEEIFDSYQIPSDVIPDIGETLTIIGHGLTGVLAVEGRAREQCPDGSFLLTSDLRDGLMGAAVFNDNEEYVGIITGIIRPDRQFQETDNRDYLVLYPAQIWYMWSKLVVLSEEYTEYSFGVTALSSISLTCSRPSGIHIVSVSTGSIAWEAGLRPGDLITHINGTPVYHPETLRGLLILSDDTLQATVLRSTFERNIPITPFEQN
ncbi:MAG: PDZ domain-containing protein [Candidatus Aegiribacteria sp.]|nr:PDZ domain-containing protein [Candidatus Aegiribacteria sp.]